MLPPVSRPLSSRLGKLLNNTFYRFLFSFIAVIAGVLGLILIIGIGSGV